MKCSSVDVFAVIPGYSELKNSVYPVCCYCEDVSFGYVSSWNSGFMSSFIILNPYNMVTWKNTTRPLKNKFWCS